MDPALAKATNVLLQGGVVAIPTESSYGLAAAINLPAAVAKVCQIKGRDQQHTLGLLIASREQLDALVSRVPAYVDDLVARHWPGPLTVVLPARPGLAPALVGAQGGVAVRISSNAMATALAEAVGPITATSANLSGQPPAQDAQAAALAGVDWVLDGGRCEGIASTVVDCTGDEPRVLREGAITLSAASA